MPAYELKHIVGFQETSLAGNVYYVNYIGWQGRCREMFLKEKAPDILRQLGDDLRLVTVSCSCDYLAELSAFDEIVIRMRLRSRAQNRLSLSFEYVRVNGTNEELIARGKQTIACMRQDGPQMHPVHIPDSLLAALQPYESPE